MNTSSNKQISSVIPPGLLMRYRVVYGLCRCCWTI